MMLGGPEVAPLVRSLFPDTQNNIITNNVKSLGVSILDRSLTFGPNTKKCLQKISCYCTATQNGIKGNELVGGRATPPQPKRRHFKKSQDEEEEEAEKKEQIRLPFRFPYISSLGSLGIIIFCGAPSP